MDPEISQLFDLSTSEKLQLVEDLWDSIVVSAPETVPIPAWQREELAKRKARYLENPDSGVPWDEAKERIRKPDG